MKKVLTIFFGEMGSGKNYWGETMSRWFPDFPFFDGDTVVPAEMAEKVAKFKPLTREMIKNYIDIFIDETEKRMEASEKGIFLAQALYFDEDRIEIKKYFESIGYAVIMYWIRPSWWQNLWQILKRKNGILWAIYWAMNKPYFQKPTHDHSVIS